MGKLLKSYCSGRRNAALAGIRLNLPGIRLAEEKGWQALVARAMAVC
jgi:hypothetical protein